MHIGPHIHVLRLVTQSHPTLWSPMNYSLPGSSVHEILQARILEWVTMPTSRGSSQPRDQTQASRIAGRLFTIWATRKAQEYWSELQCPSPGELSKLGIEPGLLGKLPLIHTYINTKSQAKHTHTHMYTHSHINSLTHTNTHKRKAL